MSENNSKPKVFLSHSKADIVFIKRIESSLRKCQIEPWLDELEIRPGKPWLDQIFTHGIPTCDAIFVYFTEASITSKVVAKEIDSGILQQLSDETVAFLPYVSDPVLRDGLRSDIRSLQIPVLNKSSFDEVFPSIIAEVWRSYSERAIKMAVQNEKVKRLEKENELLKLKEKMESGIFSKNEEEDFQCIYDFLNKSRTFKFETNRNSIGTIALIKGGVLTIELIAKKNINFSGNNFVALLLDELWGHFHDFIKVKTDMEHFEGEIIQKDIENFVSELMMFGLLRNGSRIIPDDATGIQCFKNIAPTEKLHKFRYWLTLKKLIVRRVKFEIDFQ